MIGLTGLLRIALIVTLFLHTRCWIGRLDGLQVVHFPATGAFDRQAAVVRLSQFLIALTASNLFHNIAYTV